MDSITDVRPATRLSSWPEYRTYYQMRHRCYNRNSRNYSLYGARGIFVCERWSGKDGVKNFIKDMGLRPTPKHSLDRINNNGNYEPSNCRWATKNQQQWNRRKAFTNTSGYIGVIRDKQRNVWMAKIDLGYRNMFYVGYFDDPEQAALAYDCAVIFFRGGDGVTNII